MIAFATTRRAYALAILPLLMQLVQTRMRFGAPLTRAFTACRFTFQRRRVTLCAWEMLLPNCGPFPQTSHTCAIVQLQIFECFTEAGTRRDAVRTTSPEACRIRSE